jgi:hypothetical protein
VWHVAALGEPPIEALQRRIETIRSTGEPVRIGIDRQAGKNRAFKLIVMKLISAQRTTSLLI